MQTRAFRALILLAGLGPTAALAQSGAHYQLVEVTPKPNSVAADWTVTLDAGLMRTVSPFGTIECTWEPTSIDTIHADGADVVLKVSATSVVPGNSVGGFVQLNQGFGPNSELGPVNYIDIRAQSGETVTDTITLHINPHLPNDFAKNGDRIYVDVGGCEAGTVTYTYEYRAN